MDCNETLEQLADYLDEEARAELCRAIEEHLGRCKDCKIYVDTVRKTIMLYQADREVTLPSSVGTQLTAALQQEYRNAAKGPRTD